MMNKVVYIELTVHSASTAVSVELTDALND